MSFLNECLSAIAAQTYKSFEVFIVDNGGIKTGDGYHDIDLPDARFRQIKAPVNTGYSGGMARGSGGAQSKWLMSVNPDTMISPHCLEELMKAAELYDDPAMLSPCLFSDSQHSIIDGLGDSLSITGLVWRNSHGKAGEYKKLKQPITEVFSPSGAAALYLRAAYEEACGINPAFFCYMEDVDLGLRLRAYGGKCLLVKAATAVHTGGHSTQKLTGFATKYASRNSLLMIVSSAPLPIMIPLLLTHILSRSALQWRTRGSESAKFRAMGTREALPMLWPVFKKRFARPAYPFGASLKVLKRLDWSLTGHRRMTLNCWDAPKL
jgi:GT2 family glycosyltransferase